MQVAWSTRHSVSPERDVSSNAQPTRHGCNKSIKKSERSYRFRSHFPQIAVAQRKAVHVPTPTEVEANLPHFLPDDNKQDIAREVVRASEEALLTQGMKLELDHVVMKQGSVNDKEYAEGRPDPKKLAGLFKQVQNFALYNAQSHELHTVRDELVYNSQLCDAVKVYLATKVCEQPRTRSMPQCVCWHC